MWTYITVYIQIQAVAHELTRSICVAIIEPASHVQRDLGNFLRIDRRTDRHQGNPQKDNKFFHQLINGKIHKKNVMLDLL